LLQDESLARGAGLFDAKRFFEAHEAWEERWAAATDETERRFLQGLIQVAAGFHKLLEMKSAEAASRLLAKGLAKLDSLPERVEELGLAPFCDSVRTYARHLAAGQFDTAAIPTMSAPGASLQKVNDLFLRACRREAVDRTPVWFMRQAGRYMPEYRALREKHTLLELCKTPDLAVAVTLQPLRLGVDAAILFADILLPLEPMGASFEFAKGEGPVIHEPIASREQIERLRIIDPEESLAYVVSAVKALKRELKVPLIGFAGGPFTLSSYLVEGGKSANFAKTKKLMFGAPDAWHALMRKLAEVVRRYLRAQVSAGVDAVQLFDSWVGDLAPEDYVEYVQPHVRHVLGDLEKTGVPVIHFGTGTATLLEAMRDAGGTVIGVDWCTPLAAAWERVGRGCAVQGNMDPCALLATREVAVKHAQRVLDAAAGRPGHVFNLGHGILPETPVDHVRAVVDYVGQASAR
jgi:uroporphyrinogen decarboxylase